MDYVERRIVERAVREFAYGEDYIRFVRDKVGTDRWLVASRLSSSLIAQGYEVAIPREKFQEFSLEYGWPRFLAVVDEMRRKSDETL